MGVKLGSLWLRKGHYRSMRGQYNSVGFSGGSTGLNGTQLSVGLIRDQLGVLVIGGATCR